MTNTKLTLVIMFVTAFAAGISTGLVVDRSVRPMPPPPFMLNELNLTPNQQEKVHSIWAEVLKKRTPGHNGRDALRRDRDEEIRGLLANEEQRNRFAEIQQKYDAKQEALSQDWKKIEDDAIEQTKAILNEEQRKKFEVMVNERLEFRKRDKTDRENKGDTTSPTHGE